MELPDERPSAGARTIAAKSASFDMTGAINSASKKFDEALHAALAADKMTLEEASLQAGIYNSHIFNQRSDAGFITSTAKVPKGPEDFKERLESSKTLALAVVDELARKGNDAAYFAEQKKLVADTYAAVQQAFEKGGRPSPSIA